MIGRRDKYDSQKKKGLFDIFIFIFKMCYIALLSSDILEPYSGV